MASVTNVPSDSGQRDAGNKSYYLRIHVSRVYDSATNKSTLTITPQFKGGANNVTHGVGGTLKVNGTTLMTLSSGNPYGFITPNDGGWTSLQNVSTHAVYSVTCEITHDSSGAGTARFQVDFRTADAGGTVSNEFAIDSTETYTETIPGTVGIYADNEWGGYQSDIYDGSAWQRYEPYVYTDQGWVKY